MKKHFVFCLLSLSTAAFCLLFMTGCWTSIWTVAPTAEYVAPVKTVYTTHVTTPSPKVTTTTTVTVTSFNNDWSFYLDLQAVAAAFAEANSAQEFERILNSSRYMINNLDLNGDGWVDYLRVIETRQGYKHAFLIQACLSPSMYQDVATLVAEWFADRLYVEVIGDRYLYGYNYVVRPVFVKRPPMWTVFGRPTYNPWISPYHYSYLPSYYTRPKPLYLNHYQAYVNTYMTNHHYCHHCDHPQEPYWSGYSTLTQPNTRHDYQTAHPNDSFEQRVTHRLTANGSGVTVRNAGQLRTETQRQVKSNTTETSTRTSGTSSSSTRTSGTSGTSSSSTRTSGTSTRQTESKPSQTQQSAAKREPSTTVTTRVNKSGTTRTTIKTTDTTGRTTTVKRDAPAKSSTSTRSSGTNTRSSGTSTRSGDTSTRSGGTSTSQSGTRTRR